jgi:hypothetical protein
MAAAPSAAISVGPGALRRGRSGASAPQVAGRPLSVGAAPSSPLSRDGAVPILPGPRTPESRAAATAAAAARAARNEAAAALAATAATTQAEATRAAEEAAAQTASAQATAQAEATRVANARAAAEAATRTESEQAASRTAAALAAATAARAAAPVHAAPLAGAPLAAITSLDPGVLQLLATFAAAAAAAAATAAAGAVTAAAKEAAPAPKAPAPVIPPILEAVNEAIQKPRSQIKASGFIAAVLSGADIDGTAVTIWATPGDILRPMLLSTATTGLDTTSAPAFPLAAYNPGGAIQRTLRPHSSYWADHAGSMLMQPRTQAAKVMERLLVLDPTAAIVVMHSMSEHNERDLGISRTGERISVPHANIARADPFEGAAGAIEATLCLMKQLADAARQMKDGEALLPATRATMHPAQLDGMHMLAREAAAHAARIPARLIRGLATIWAEAVLRAHLTRLATAICRPAEQYIAAARMANERGHPLAPITDINDLVAPVNVVSEFEITRDMVEASSESALREAAGHVELGAAEAGLPRRITFAAEPAGEGGARGGKAGLFPSLHPGPPSAAAAPSTSIEVMIRPLAVTTKERMCKVWNCTMDTLLGHRAIRGLQKNRCLLDLIGNCNKDGCRRDHYASPQEKREALSLLQMTL